MTRLPRVSGREVIRALPGGGFTLSHYLRKPGTQSLVVVPVHGNRTLPIGTMRSILRQAGLTSQGLSELMLG